MEKQNKYWELKAKLKDIKDNDESLNEVDRNLIGQVLTLLEVDKVNKLSKYTVNKSDTAKVLDIVSQSIAGYRIYLDNLIDGDHKVIYINEYREIKSRLEKLNELRNEIEDYCSVQTIKYENWYEELLYEVKESLIGNPASLLFERLMSIKDDPDTENIYDALENQKFYVDLKKSINIDREKKKNLKIIELCEDIISYRNTLRENVKKLVEYNQLYAELTSKVNVESIEELKQKKERLQKCNKDLLSSGLSNLLLGLNTNLKLALNRSNTPLTIYLQDVKNEYDLITYFIEVKELHDRLYQYINRGFIFEEMYLMNTADPTALTITNTDKEVARLLVNFANEDGSPSLKTMLVEMILAMETTPIEDMNVNEREFINMEKHLSKKSQNEVNEFFERYTNIMNSNEKESVNTK